MKKVIINLIIIALSVVLGYFASDLTKVNALSDPTDDSLSKSELDMLIEIKGLNNTNQDRQKKVLRQFIENNAIAAYIGKQTNMDFLRTNVEFKEKRNEMIIKAYMEAFQSEPISDSEIKQYHEKNIKQFSRLKLNLSHILLKTHPRMSESQIDEKQKQADQLRNTIAQGGDFSVLAKENSDDVLSAGKNGELGWIYKDRRTMEIFQTAEKLKVGEISDVIKSSKGFHIVKLLAEPKYELGELENVKEKIRYQLTHQSRIDELSRFKKATEQRVNREISALLK